MVQIIMSHKQLTPTDRFYIQKRLELKISKLQISKELGVSHTTISREVKRNLDPLFKGMYNHLVANRMLCDRRMESKRKTKVINHVTGETETYILERLKLHTSPKVISGELKLNKDTFISKNTIYRYLQLDRSNGGKLYLDLPHSGKPYRPKSDACASKIVGRVGIENRPAIADLKIEPGHFEVDTIFGLGQESFLLTLVDKANKSTIVRKLSNKCAATVVEAMRKIMKTTFHVFKTITSDNGTEFAGHAKISEITGASFFFANPYSSWERGLNEHTNGLIRRFFPKGTDFNTISDEDIAKVEFILNSRGRESLKFKSPNQVMLEYLQAA